MSEDIKQIILDSLHYAFSNGLITDSEYDVAANSVEEN